MISFDISNYLCWNVTGHEEVWHGYIDLVLPSYPSYPSSYEDMPSIAKIVVQMDEEKHSKKRKLDFDGKLV